MKRNYGPAQPAGAASGAVRAGPARPAARPEKSERERKRRYRRSVMSTFGILAAVMAGAVLVSMYLVSILQIRGSSMAGTLNSLDVVFTVRSSIDGLDRGDVVAFYYNENVMVKRVIALPGETVEIREGGTVYIDGKALDEKYARDLTMGQCNLEFPYEVPEGRVFVMGDNRPVSVDSRNASVGCVSGDQLIGEVALRVWPLSGFGPVG